MFFFKIVSYSNSVISFTDKGKISEDYEDCPDLDDDEKDRKIDSFVKWINSKMSKPMTGGKRKKSNKKRSNKRRRSNKKTNKRKRTKRTKTYRK